MFVANQCWWRVTDWSLVIVCRCTTLSRARGGEGRGGERACHRTPKLRWAVGDFCRACSVHVLRLTEVVMAWRGPCGVAVALLRSHRWQGSRGWGCKGAMVCERDICWVCERKLLVSSSKVQTYMDE